jgi:hypothetical protein
MENREKSPTFTNKCIMINGFLKGFSTIMAFTLYLFLPSLLIDRKSNFLTFFRIIAPSHSYLRLYAHIIRSLTAIVESLTISMKCGERSRRFLFISTIDGKINTSYHCSFLQSFACPHHLLVLSTILMAPVFLNEVCWI